MTRRQELQKLPLQKRLQAIENTRREESYFTLKARMDQEDCTCILSFVYRNTRQGHDYWWKINKKYFQ